jgi:hypothetical protein
MICSGHHIDQGGEGGGGGIQLALNELDGTTIHHHCHDELEDTLEGSF